MKKTIIRTIAIALICSFVIPVSAFAATTNEVITATMYRNLTVTYNSEKQTFFDANGKQVFPIASEGTVYIPVRAMSNLLKTSIEWNGDENKINIGNSTFVEPTYTAKKLDSNTSNESISVTVMKDLTVMYNGKEQSFFDVNGKQVYPVAANGTTYLPIRATSKMFDTVIEWIGSENRIAIGTDKPITPEIPNEEYKTYDFSEGTDFYDAIVKGTGDAVTVRDAGNMSDIFTGKVMTIEGVTQDVSGVYAKIYPNTDPAYVNFTLYNYSDQSIRVELHSSEGHREFIVLKPGEVKDCHEKMAFIEWFAFTAYCSTYPNPSVKVAIGNIEFP